MSYHRCVVGLVLLAVCAAFPALGDGPDHLATTVSLQESQVRLEPGKDAYVTQTTRIELAAGDNDLAFDFGTLGIPLDALDFGVEAAAGRLAVSELSIVPQAPGVAHWTVTADERCDAQVTVGFPLKGIEWRVEYSAVVYRDVATLDIEAGLVVTNKSPIQFPAAQVSLPGGLSLVTPLKRDETLEAHLYTANSVPYQASFVYDAPRYGAGVVALMRVLRQGDAQFAQSPVPAGKIQLYSPGAPGVYLGEDNLPYLAPREPLNIKLGTVPDLPVARKLVSATRIDTKSDVRDKLVLFNEDDVVEIEVKNLRKVPVDVLVRDEIAGDWSIVKQSDEFSRVDADTIQFEVTLQPGETKTIGYTARRYNLQP